MGFLLVIAYGEVIISSRLQHDNRQLMIMSSVLISYCVCRRPSWTPKTQPNGSSAIVWLSFWCSTRFTRKKLDHSRGTYLYIVVPYRHLTQPALPLSGRVFDVHLGLRQKPALINTTSLLSGKSTWTPKPQPNDSRATVWLSFWCSTRHSVNAGT